MLHDVTVHWLEKKVVLKFIAREPLCHSFPCKWQFDITVCCKHRLLCAHYLTGISYGMYASFNVYLGLFRHGVRSGSNEHW